MGLLIFKSIPKKPLILLEEKHSLKNMLLF